MRRGLGDALEDLRKVADRHPLAQERLKHALHGGRGGHRRDQVFDQFLLLGGQVLEQLLHLAIREQVGHVLFQDLGEVGGQDRGRVDSGVAAESGLFAQVLGDPGGGKAEGGFTNVFAGEFDLAAARVHGHQMTQADLAGSRLHFLGITKPYSPARVLRRALIWSVRRRPSRSLIRFSRP